MDLRAYHGMQRSSGQSCAVDAGWEIHGFQTAGMDQGKKHIPKLAVLFVPVVAVSVYQRMDKVMLGSLSVMEQSGYYENVEKIINIPKGVITALGTVMLPRMSYLISREETGLIEQYTARSMEFVMFSSSAMAFGIAAVANDFAPFSSAAALQGPDP